MKKRSLIVATAMLLVAILASSGATYAWFTRNNSATVDSITMTVDTTSGLRISGDSSSITAANIIDDSKWFGTISSSDIADFDSGADVLHDLSTTDDTFGTFYQRIVTGNTTTYEAGTVASVTVYFRASTADAAVKLASSTITPTKAGIANAVRIGTTDGTLENTFGKVAGTNSSAIAAEAGTTGTQTVIANTTSTTVVTCAGSQSGFYYGTLTVYFWIEGTDAACIDSNSGGSVNIALNFSL